MASRKRRKNNQAALVIEIILCIITLSSVTASLFFLLKYNSEKKEKEAAVEELSVYQDPENPYYSQSEVDEKVSEAASTAQENAKQEGRNEVKNSIKSDLLENASSIGMIRRLFSDEIVVVDDNQFYFLPINETLAKSSYADDSFSMDEDGRMTCSAASYRTGIDVSKFQETVNWSKVAADGIDYAFIRAGIRGYTEGEIFEDTTFEDNMEGASKNGIDIGVYFFGQATSNEEAIEEAEFVLDLLEPYKITYPVVLDVEEAGGDDGRASSLTMEERTEYAITFCEKIKQGGYTPMIYGNIKTFTLMLDMEKLEDYPKWFAGYTDTPYFPYKFDVWQYTESGSVSGISSDVDLNISFYEP